MPPALACTAVGEKCIQIPWAVGEGKKVGRRRKKVLALPFLVNHVIQHPSSLANSPHRHSAQVSHLGVAGGTLATSISLPTVSFAYLIHPVTQIHT